MDFFEKPTIQSCAYSVLYSEKDCCFFFVLIHQQGTSVIGPMLLQIIYITYLCNG